MSSDKNKFHSIRAALLKYLTTQRMFWTAALMAEVDEWKVLPKIGNNGQESPIAYVSTSSTIAIAVREDILNSCVVFDEPEYNPSKVRHVTSGDLSIEVSGYVLFTVILHELRHIPQVFAENKLAEDILLPKINDILKVRNVDKPTKRQIKAFSGISKMKNIVMDMQLHRDILKSPEIKAGFNQLSNYLKISSLSNLRKTKEVISSKDSSIIEKLSGLLSEDKIEEEIQRLEDEIRNAKGDYQGNLCTVEQFDEFFPDKEGKHPVNLSGSWADLLNIAFLRTLDNNNGEGEGDDEGEGDGEGEGEGKKGKGKKSKGASDKPGSFDEHDFDPSEDQEEKRDRQRRLDKAIKGAAAGGDILQRNAGKGGDAGDAAMFVKEKKIDVTLIRLISRIKTAINLLSKPVEYRQTWAVTRLRGNVCLPSERQISDSKASCGIALVLDTSGSMWSDDILNASYSVSKALQRAGKLGGLYYGDTVISKVDLSEKIPTVFKGGGGTELASDHVELIRKDLNLKDNQVLDIVYVS